MHVQARTPSVADGGELIIYAPHIQEICVSHGANIRKVGYHCRDLFSQAVWTGLRTFRGASLRTPRMCMGWALTRNEVETPRVRVSLATGLSEETCRQINLGYRDWRGIRVEDFQNREDAGVLHVPKAGEMLYQLKQPPSGREERDAGFG
jgi:hypothetical protein